MRTSDALGFRILGYVLLFGTGYWLGTYTGFLIAIVMAVTLFVGCCCLGHAVRLTERAAKEATHVGRYDGFRPVCSCGWKGTVQPDHVEAGHEFFAHMEDVMGERA